MRPARTHSKIFGHGSRYNGLRNDWTVTRIWVQSLNENVYNEAGSLCVHSYRTQMFDLCQTHKIVCVGSLIEPKCLQ